jgi:hypothetical protein
MQVMAIEAHLQMIQAVISRLAGQSTTVKGWSITLTGALLGYGASTRTPLIAFVAGYAVIAFAALDGYYLALERGYRSLYTEVLDGQAEDWSMVNPRPIRSLYLKATFSLANIILYGASLSVVAIIGVFLALR